MTPILEKKICKLLLEVPVRVSIGNTWYTQIRIIRGGFVLKGGAGYGGPQGTVQPYGCHYPRPDVNRSGSQSRERAAHRGEGQWPLGKGCIPASVNSREEERGSSNSLFSLLPASCWGSPLTKATQKPEHCQCGPYSSAHQTESRMHKGRAWMWHTCHIWD